MRAIDKRFLSPVAGIDLEECLNYIALDEAGETFCYEHYTGSRLPYVRGSRRGLELLAGRLTKKARTPFDKVAALTGYVANECKWAGFFAKETGKPLPPDRNLTEEELLLSGYGWCNEQARLLCVLTQVLGIPSRLVYAANLKKKYGHVMVEVLLPEGWMTVDQSLNYCFLMKGRPVRASRVWRDPKSRAHFRPVYKKLCEDLIGVLGRGVLKTSFRMSLAADPLDGFTDIGFHNHYVL